MIKDQKKREDLQTIYNTPSERLDLKSDNPYVAPFPNGSFLCKSILLGAASLSLFFGPHTVMDI